MACEVGLCGGEVKGRIGCTISLEQGSKRPYLTLMASSAESRRGQHVMPNGKGWSVVKAGAARASSRHDTQEAAIAAARKVAMNQKTELYIHGTDGRIRERRSFGNDHHIPKG